MSYELTRLAFARTDLKSSTKFVLVALSFRANEKNQCWPSIKWISQDTGLDRKTVILCLQELQDKQLIFKTGEFKGRTKSVAVYQLTLQAVPKTELLKTEAVPLFPVSSPKNGTPKQSQKRDTEYKDRIEKEYNLSYSLYLNRFKSDRRLGLVKELNPMTYEEWQATGCPT